MQYMFNGCSALSNLNISSFRTQNVENMSYMFNDCQSLTTIDVSNFNTESVNDISRMFYGTGIQSLDLRSFNTSGFEYYEDYLSLNTTAVTLGVNWNIGLDSGLWRNTAGQEYNYNEIPQNVEDTYYRVSLFWGINTDTHTLYISGQPVTGENFVSGTINKDGSFSEDWSPWALTEEDILYVVVGTSNTDIVRPTYMTKWFALLKYAVSFDFTYLNTENVINMSQLFYDCESVETLDLRRFNTAKVTTMDGMFKNCYNLSNLDVSSFNTSNVRSINDMFLSTSSLESLNISNFDLSKVALKDDVFSASGIRLISVSSTFNGIELPEGDYEDISTGMLYAYNELPQNKAATYKMKILYYSINNGVLRISNNELTTGIYGTASARGTDTPWTNENDQITKVIVGEDGNKVKPLSTANWFLYLENVSLFDLKNLDTSNVVDMSSMFEGCTSMTTIDVSNFNTSKVEDMTSMFSDTGLTSINLSKLDFSKVEYTIAMFENSSNLTSVNLGNPNTSNLIDARYMFTNCSSLESFDLSALDTSSIQTFASMFAGCVSLKEMDLRNVDFSASDDINAMFAGCENLEIVRLSDFSQFVIDNEAGYPDDYIFGECPKLNILVTKGFNEEIDYEGADISIYDANHNKRTSGRIRTGDYILADGSDEGETIEIPIIIMGDVTKDGLVNISDVMKIATHIIKKNIIKTNAERIAANVIRSNTSNVLETQDKDINISDVMKIATYIIKGGVLEWEGVLKVK